MEENLISENDGLSQIVSKNIEWTKEHDCILVEWADKAMCYRWLHSKAHALYYSLNAWYTIPVIIISTLTGTANFAQERVPLDYQKYFVMLVGAFNILAGIITTIQQFLKITQLSEAHRVSSIAWDKFYRNIKIELTKHPSERIDVTHMIKMSKEEFDRLMETSPSIPEKIVNQFKNNFNSQEMFQKIIKPEICDILIPTNDYRNPWNNDVNINNQVTETIKLQLEKQNKLQKINEHNDRILSEFISVFINLNNRNPMESEVIDNLKDKIDVETIQKKLNENKHYLFINSENDSEENYV